MAAGVKTLGEDLGHDHFLSYASWRPDRELNPQYAHLPDVEKYGATIDHFGESGEPCAGFVFFDSPTSRELDGSRPKWTVLSWEPLTLDPSILCPTCGDHGHIRDGQWVPA